jgi:hypothetical protein
MIAFRHGIVVEQEWVAKPNSFSMWPAVIPLRASENGSGASARTA